MTTTSIGRLLIAILLLAGCDNRLTKSNNEEINFNDTLLDPYILFINYGDTIRAYNKIYFMPTDPTVDTSNFFYQACKQPCAARDIFRAYFSRDKVIAYCDSMLQAVVAYQNRGDESIFSERISFEHIKEQAINNKLDTTIYVDELSILLDRFRPLIYNPHSGDKPTHIIVKNQHTKTQQYNTYLIKTQTGDTVFLALTNLRAQEIRLRRNK